MLATIVNIQPKDAGSGGGETRETIVYRLADDMLDKLPEDYIPFEVGALQLCVVTSCVCVCVCVWWLLWQDILLAMDVCLFLCCWCVIIPLGNFRIGNAGHFTEGNQLL